MIVSEIEQLRSAPCEHIFARMEGRVFHATTLKSWEQIQADGAIMPNVDLQFGPGFGSTNSFFRKRGCICLFDYREPPPHDDIPYRDRCRPLSSRSSEDGATVLLFLDKVTLDRLIPWSAWKQEKAYGDAVVPYVEAGHPGPLQLDDIVECLIVRLQDDPNDPLAAFFRTQRQRSAK